MTPIERVQRRAVAATWLNLSIHTPADDLKREWKRRAFLAHPDRNSGNDHEFRSLKTAFEILLGTADDDVIFDTREEVEEAAAVRPKRVVSRPRSKVARPA